MLVMLSGRLFVKTAFFGFINLDADYWFNSDFFGFNKESEGAVKTAMVGYRNRGHIVFFSFI